MSTPAQTANGAASYVGIPDKLAAIIYLLNTSNMTATQIADGAKTYTGLNNKLDCIIYLLANGGAGGSANIYAADYGGTTPSVTPSGTAVALDTSTGSFWFYDGSTWTELIA